MKNYLLVLILFISYSCSSDKQGANSSDSESSFVTEFLNDVTSIESVSNSNPILQFKEDAENIANDILSFSKDNMNDIIENAKRFKHCVITVADHTIIRITDLEDCVQSGSWATKMPFCEGYIKKGELVYQKDYLNNIIGIPDSQERTAYFFN